MTAYARFTSSLSVRSEIITVSPATGSYGVRKHSVSSLKSAILFIIKLSPLSEPKILK